jgi:hypothetical protein
MTEHEYARRALSELVAHVLSTPAGPVEGLNYKTLAFRIGRRSRDGNGVAIGMGRILGRMGHMLQDLEGHWGKPIPHIQSLVTDKRGKNAGLPADGIEEFWPDYRDLTKKEKQARVRQEHKKILAFGDGWKRVLAKLEIRPTGNDAKSIWLDDEISFWVVSPNVRNNETTVDAWRQASVRARAAFMGWYPDDHGHAEIGPAFAGKTSNGIKPRDVILIARRHHHEPEIIGFGVVQGEAERRLPGLKTPESFGSLRRLKPFVAWSGPPPDDIPLRNAVRHTRALAQLHPDWNDDHRRVCEWIAWQFYKAGSNTGAKIPKKRKLQSSTHSKTRIVASPQNHQLDYKVQTRAKVIRAERAEAALLQKYNDWLRKQERTLVTLKYKTLQCDAFEEHRNNLVEAKSSARREHIRMAVGQLLDYAFQGNDKFGDPHKAILLPSAPSSDITDWLDSLGIKIIWREKGAFLDNANGQFT